MCKAFGVHFFGPPCTFRPLGGATQIFTRVRD